MDGYTQIPSGFGVISHTHCQNHQRGDNGEWGEHGNWLQEQIGPRARLPQPRKPRPCSSSHSLTLGRPLPTTAPLISGPRI